MPEKIEIHRVTTKQLLRAFGTRKPQTLRLGVSTFLARQPGRIFTVAEIVDHLYGGRLDGGPLWAQGNISVIICCLRKEGAPIKTVGMRGYAFIRKEEADALDRSTIP